MTAEQFDEELRVQLRFLWREAVEHGVVTSQTFQCKRLGRCGYMVAVPTPDGLVGTVIYHDRMYTKTELHDIAKQVRENLRGDGFWWLTRRAADLIREFGY